MYVPKKVYLCTVKTYNAMKNHLFQSFILCSVMTALFACKGQLPEDPVGQAVGVKAQIKGFESNTESWTTGDVIGVSIPAVNNNYNVPYTTDGDGSFSAVASPVYIVGTQAHEVAAYYPYDPTATQSNPEIAFTEPVDWLFANTTVDRENTAVQLNFYHRMARLSIVFSETVDYQIFGIVQSGRMHTGTGVVTAVGAPQEISGSGQQLDILLPAQTLSGSANVAWGERTFIVNLDMTLEAGKWYQYRAKLDEETESIALTEMNGSIIPWEEVDGGDLVVTEKEPDLAVGDYYLADGTTISHLRTLSAAQKAQVIGIVCELGSNTDDSTRLADFPNCTTAKVIALYDGTARAWNTATVSTTMCAWMINSGLENQYLWPARYKKDAAADGMISASASANRDKICQGYNNTKLWKQYIGSATTYSVLSELNSMSAPTGTTGWYVASVGDLNALLVDASINTTVQASLTALGATIPYGQALWTSSESCLTNGAQASMTVNFKNGEGTATVGLGKAVHTKTYPTVFMLNY